MAGIALRERIMIESAIKDQLAMAARNADWGQVVCNGGPPCFHLELPGKFCLRSERWAGHGLDDHEFVSFEKLIERITQPPNDAQPAATAPKDKPIGWISEESLRRLKAGGNSRGSVPVHSSFSMVARIPLVIASPTKEAGL
jgi:hypothetical protein